MKKSFVLATAGLAAALAPLSAAMAQGPQVEVIGYSSRKPQPLVAGSSLRNFAFGAVGGFVIDRFDGPNIDRKMGVQDPQDQIALAVATQIAQRRGAEVADAPLDVGSLSRGRLARSGPPGRFLVDVESTQRKFMWSLIRGQWTKYTVGYRANLAVLDIPNQEFVVRDHCHWTTPKADRVSRVRMLENNAEELKVQLDRAAEACTAQFVDASQALWRSDERRAAQDWAPPQSPRRPAPVQMAPLPDNYPADYSADYPAPRYRPAAAPRPMPAPAPRPTYAQHRQPVIVEYSYARPYEAPPARAPVSEERYATRDANGYLVWSTKQP